MILSAPKVVVWLLSTTLVALVLTLRYTGLDVPQVGGLVEGRLFETLLAAYALLWMGTVFRGV